MTQELFSLYVYRHINNPTPPEIDKPVIDGIIADMYSDYMDETKRGALTSYTAGNVSRAYSPDDVIKRYSNRLAPYRRIKAV